MMIRHRHHVDGTSRIDDDDDDEGRQHGSSSFFLPQIIQQQQIFRYNCCHHNKKSNYNLRLILTFLILFAFVMKTLKLLLLEDQPVAVGKMEKISLSSSTKNNTKSFPAPSPAPSLPLSSDGGMINNIYNNTQKDANASIVKAKKKKVGFIHFHKAGGSSMVATLLKHYQLWNPNRNGNPFDCCDHKGSQYMVKFWMYNSTQFKDFLQRRNKNSKIEWQFVAMEWNFFTQLTREEEVTPFIDLITCIRDPYDRFVSNLFFNIDLQRRNMKKRDVAKNAKYINNSQQAAKYYSQNPMEWMNLNFTKANLPKWQNFDLNYNKFNYYTAFLNGLAEESHDNRTPLTVQHLEIAKERLRWFKAIIILEQTETHQTAFEKLGLPPQTRLVHENVARGSSKPLTGGNSTSNSHNMISMTREEFYQLNSFDKELYDYAIELATKST